MIFLHIPIVRPTIITHAISGSFFQKGANEFILCRSRQLELARIDEQYCLSILHSQSVFGVVLSMSLLHKQEYGRDFIVLGTDDGNINIIEFNPIIEQFLLVQTLFLCTPLIGHRDANEFIAIDN
ncbi:MAG: hypothetical protein EZS28_011900 [Streblomastix strix]|uniref:RSE1/DDB1/CPSF1 first beta-propeller domain-containing protein n=1 Tax=Streblomastix strix TaxID=222440 RepID=A0A5J4WDQ9_9EUKA|nr:MAG: hypothetical protein EZS28_011900 [Streblomastix strix]